MIESDIHERSNEPASLAAHGVFRASGGKVTKRVTNFLAGSPRSRPKEQRASTDRYSPLSASPTERIDDREIIYRLRKFRKMTTYVTRERRCSLDMCRPRKSRPRRNKGSSLRILRETFRKVKDILSGTCEASNDSVSR